MAEIAYPPLSHQVTRESLRQNAIEAQVGLRCVASDVAVLYAPLHGIVVEAACWLPVGPVPEKLLVAEVRHYMVDHGCRYHPPDGLASEAVGVRLAIVPGRLLPGRIVAAVLRITALGRTEEGGPDRHRL